jgi:hypothetical protein
VEKVLSFKFYKCIFLLGIIAFSSLASIASSYVEYSPNLKEGMAHLAALRLKQAELIFAKEANKHEQNIAVSYLNHYLSFFQIMIQQDKGMLSAFEKVNELTLKKIETLPASSPYRLFYKGSVHLQSAIVKSLFNEYLGAAWDFKIAFQEVNLNEKNFPDFISHKKELGTLKALLGSFPPQYNWILQAVGLEGDFNLGLKILKKYIDQSQHEPLIEQQQASLIYALIQLNFGKNRQAALQFYLPYAKDYQTNLMQCYVLTYIAAKSGQNNLALKTLKAKPIGSNYVQIVYLDYIMGDLLLRQLDQNAAIWFKRYITFTKTKNANKEAYQKLSWLAWMDNDSAKFFVYHDLMQKNTKDAGSELKLINHDLGKGVFPSKQLLEVRLLFDGGYYEKALQKMNNVSISALPSKFQQIEYHYRLGRIFQELGKNAEAIQSYKACLALGKDAKTYLIPNACLQLGLIYENLNYYELAKAYYEQVLNYEQVDYESSLHQKAKTHIWRLKQVKN